MKNKSLNRGSKEYPPQINFEKHYPSSTLVENLPGRS